MKSTRTKNSILNLITSVGGEFLNIVLSFISRSVFIATLGSSYLGISGLFSNILSLLSLAEFGVGNAILFKLYEPLSRDDQPRITLLMKFYKQIYRGIGTVVAMVGLCLIPFLKYVISDYDSLEQLGINATIIFLLYLVNSVSSYLFFAYKSSIIKADQREYVLNGISLAFTLGKNILQIVVLIFSRNFELYILVMIASMIIQNLINAIIANKQYPYINDKIEDKVSRDEVKSIAKDCGSIFLYRLNGVVLKSTDNIVLSAFMGLDAVALYSNYYVFYTSINTIVSKIYSSVAHSIGNLHATNDNGHEYLIFRVMEFITAIIGGTALVGIFVISDEFIHTWIGSNWTIAQPFSLLMGIELYTLAVRSLLTKYRNAMGLFQQAKFRPLLGAIINVVISIALVNTMGIAGVILGTVIADWTTFMVFDPIIIHKHGFAGKFSISKFYFRNIMYFILALALGGINKWLCTIILPGYGWFSVVIHVCIVAISVPVCYILIGWKKPECQYLINKFFKK